MATYLEAIRDLPVHNLAAGETLLEQGTTSGRLYILIGGKVEIVKDGQTVATSAQSGDIYGDLSALLNTPHTTSVRAVVDSSFHVATEPRTFLEQNPSVALHLSELIARRLVSVTQYLVDLKQQFDGHDHLGMVDQVLDSLLHRHPRKRVAPRNSAEIAD